MSRIGISEENMDLSRIYLTNLQYVNKRRIYLRFLLLLSNENLRMNSMYKVASTVFTGE